MVSGNLAGGGGKLPGYGLPAGFYLKPAASGCKIFI